jgi:hypothetical protein
MNIKEAHDKFVNSYAPKYTKEYCTNIHNNMNPSILEVKELFYIDDINPCSGLNLGVYAKIGRIKLFQNNDRYSVNDELLFSRYTLEEPYYSSITDINLWSEAKCNTRNYYVRSKLVTDMIYYDIVKNTCLLSTVLRDDFSYNSLLKIISTSKDRDYVNFVRKYVFEKKISPKHKMRKLLEFISCYYIHNNINGYVVLPLDIAVSLKNYVNDLLLNYKFLNKFYNGYYDIVSLTSIDKQYALFVVEPVLLYLFHAMYFNHQDELNLGVYANDSKL